MNIEQILTQLMGANFRFELLIRAIVEVLATKKNIDGTPLLTHEEVNAKAEELKNKAIEQAKIAKPSGIILPDGTLPAGTTPPPSV